MTEIGRRHTVVTLYPGNFQTELSDLLDQAMAAARAEESGAAPKRAGTRSQAIALAKQYDELLATANDAAIKVHIDEISNIDWQKLADEHPPRDGDERDRAQGINMQTFLPLLLRAAIKPGQVDLDALSRVHYIKLETACWNLHAGDDALPKFSLVSLLQQQRDPDSKQPSVPE